MQQQHKATSAARAQCPHIRFIALGSAIGTGLFYGSASAIKAAGPGGAAGLSDWRRGGVYRHARAGRDGGAQPGFRLPSAAMPASISGHWPGLLPAGPTPWKW